VIGPRSRTSLDWGRAHPSVDDTSSESSVMKAWEDYLAGVDERPRVREVVAHSWERCAATGVDPKARGSRRIATPGELARRRNANAELLRAAAEICEEAKQLLADTGSMIILTDAEGVMLSAVGDPRTVEAGGEINLIIGADWGETTAGTNGIGTALAIKTPVLIHATEHFCSKTKEWTCAGSPVRDPIDGTLLGLVDMSGYKETFQPHNLGLTVMIARRIEAALMAQRETERRMLIESAARMKGDSRSHGLVVVDRKGRVIETNESAAALLTARARAVGAPYAGPTDRGEPLLRPLTGACGFDVAMAQQRGIDPDHIVPVHEGSDLIGAIVVMPIIASRQAALLKRPAAFRSIVGASPCLAEAIDRAARIALHQPGVVLIQGETGVGKELFARAIHEAGPCAGGPYITFNCGAVSKDLIATELFGYVRGAFTGAAAGGHIGRFERAHNGTLCFDEIGELPLDLQPYLLRVLEEGIVYRVGDATPRPVNVRVIAMTNRDLREEVEKGRIRRDLFYRLYVSTLNLPPLRERDGDIELLAKHFLEVLSNRYGIGPRRFGADVLKLFNAYPWPGNVRELRNAVESALLLSDGELIDRTLLPDVIANFASPPCRTLMQGVSHSQPQEVQLSSQEPPSFDLRTMEKERIAKTLHRFDGNISLAASALGIARSTLYRRMERYGLLNEQSH
jgi:transcriptional regulator of acetoin/glycerol metabolism